MNIEIDVPDGISGNWAVKSFLVTKENSNFERMRSIFQHVRGYLPPGNYKKLTNNGTMVMSNTPDEIRDFLYSLSCINGKVLINGLGLGVTVKYLLNNPEITSVIVIEKSKDVINLVAPTYSLDKRFKIINEDCFKYKPPKGERYDFVWHDIWNYVTSDNLPEMHKLHRKYGKRCHDQASWCRYECERQT